MRARSLWLPLLLLLTLTVSSGSQAQLRGRGTSRIGSGAADWVVKVPAVITNTTTQPVMIASALVTIDSYQGADPTFETSADGDFSFLHNLPITLAPGQTLKFDVDKNPLVQVLFSNQSFNNGGNDFPTEQITGHVDLFSDTNGNDLVGTIPFSVTADDTPDLMQFDYSPPVPSLSGIARLALPKAAGKFILPVPVHLTNSSSYDTSVASANVVFESLSPDINSVEVRDQSAVYDTVAAGQISTYDHNHPYLTLLLDDKPAFHITPTTSHADAAITAHVELLDGNGDLIGVVLLYASNRGDINTTQPLLLSQTNKSGLVVWWEMNGNTIENSARFIEKMTPNLTLAATGVFDSTKNRSLLWRNPVTGDVIIWLMKGTQTLSKRVARARVSLDWQIVGTGDFNGDGISDIVLQNAKAKQFAVWFMDGRTQTVKSMGTKSLPTGWNLVGVGDTEGAGQADLLFRGVASNDIMRWKMKGFANVGSSIVARNIGSAWRMDTMLDYDDDGRDDVVWHNTADLRMLGWLMNGSAFLSTSTFGVKVGSDFRFVGGL